MLSKGKKMKSPKTALIAGTVLLLLTTLFSGIVLGEYGQDALSIKVIQGTSQRLGGGDWLVITTKRSLFGVIYGTEESPKGITMFSEYRRYIGGADIYDERGDFLRRVALPVSSVFSQSLVNMVEFLDRDSDGLFDFRGLEDSLLGSDTPVKFLSLAVPWKFSGYDLIRNEEYAYLNFSLTAENLSYSWIWDPTTESRVDGSIFPKRVEKITISFHVRVYVGDTSAHSIPWYRIIVEDTLGRRFMDSEFEGYRSLPGRSMNMSFKYDHHIVGWDFLSNSSKIALGTTLLVGNLADLPVVRYVHKSILMAKEEDGGSGAFEIRQDEESPDRPMVIEKNALHFYDSWYMLGRLGWISDVMVDNKTERMAFEVYGIGPATWSKNSNIYKGFVVRGAFVYPRGEEIYHDPEFSDALYLISIPSLVNVLPSELMMAQVAVGVIMLFLSFTVSIITRKKGGN